MRRALHAGFQAAFHAAFLAAFLAGFHAAFLAGFLFCAFASAARAQVVFADDAATWTLTGRALVSYAGTLSPSGNGSLQTHQLGEGVSAELAGWLVDSGYVKFRSFFLVLHLDQLAPHRSLPLSLGYGTSVRLLSRSILPITLSAMRGLTLPGSTAEAVQSASTTSLSGTAQLVSSVLPKAELQLQRVISEVPDQPRFVADSVSGAVQGESSLHRYSGIATWSAQRSGTAPSTGTLQASVSDDLYPGRNTSARLQASIAQGRGLGGAQEEGFNGYQTSASLLSRLGSRTVLRTSYAFSGAGASDRDQESNALTAGATIDLRPLPLLLGEGASATYSTIEAPGVKRTLTTVSAAQGLATAGHAGALQYGLGITGQAGYSEVSDGAPGALLGFGANASALAPLLGLPFRGLVSYARRDDESSAALSSRTLNANLTTRFVRGGVLLLPAFNYSRVAQSSPASAGWLETSAASLLLSGAAPLFRRQVSFAAGWAEGWSNQPGASANGSLFAHAGTVFSLGPGSFGNLAADVTHQLGGGTSASLLGSGVWSFRESNLSFNYVYSRAFPSDGGSHSVSVLFTRAMSSSFLPEHP